MTFPTRPLYEPAIPPRGELPNAPASGARGEIAQFTTQQTARDIRAMTLQAECANIPP